MTSSKSYFELEDGSQVVLERLDELSIKNLDCEDLYCTASLPTPEAPRVDFTLPATAKPSPYQSPLDLWYEESDGPMVPPPAPRMKDLDSFTEGTGCGSFEDLPCAATNELGELIHPTTETTISLLPPSDTLKVSIEKWRETISVGSTVPMKRRRSPSPEDNRDVRRIRPRVRAMSLPSSFKAFTEFLGFPSTRDEPEAPD
ncbi:hypothetical protein EST38_g11324 [Candolleomyces aberdarensis]|uniref:Uncharacterized protein n=1 Tax=Candolleomyces aberdarensis TaxID=2316362 RepID=A0A4Q2D564_9AGAR|nr:hypothetical protein EST38_g11324 [Candolleomyces aberdarensis]